MNVLELKEKRSEAVARQQAILDTADSAKRSMTAEENVEWGKYDTEYNNLDKQIEQVEVLEARQAKLDADQGAKLEAKPEVRKAIETAEEVAKNKSNAFEQYIRGGYANLNKEQRSSLGYMEQRAQSAGTASEGGYTVPTSMASQIEKAMLDVSGARELANVMKTSTGARIDFPTNNDTANVGVLLAENVAAGEQDTVFASTPLDAYTYTSKIIRVSNQLIEDSNFDIMSYIAQIGAERIGRGTNAAFTTGDGSAKPEGFITGATSGLTSAGATAITFDELISLEHSVDSSYRNGGAFTFNDATFAYIKKLKDGDGNYLWTAPNGQSGAAGTILGYKYAVNQSMASIATGNKAVAFGNFSKFMIRDSGTPLILRLSERFAEYNQTAFLMFTRHDSVVLDAGTAPIKYITQL